MDFTRDDSKINGTGTPDEEWLNQVHHSYFLKGANNTKFMNSHILDEDFEVPTLNGCDGCVGKLIKYIKVELCRKMQYDTNCIFRHFLI